MQSRLAAALPDRHYGKPAYHALTFGWLLAGLAGAVTGLSMRELWAAELSGPLGIDELSLGAPGPGSPLTLAEVVDPFRLGNAGLRDPVLKVMGRLPSPLGPLAGGIDAGRGSARLFKAQDPAIFEAEMGAANGVASARALARIYAPLAGRMGMQWMREELEDLSFKVLNPEARASITVLRAYSESPWCVGASMVTSR